MAGTNNSIFTNFWRCFLSPRLYRIYNTGTLYGAYDPNTLEKWGDTILQASIVLWHVSLYAFPIIAYPAYKKNYFTLEGQMLLLKLSAVGFLTIGSALVMRALGRSMNQTYIDFNEKYRYITQNYNNETKKLLQNYEFDFSAWPVDFNNNKNDKYKYQNILSCGNSTFKKAILNPLSLMGYLALRFCAIKIIYPGSIRSLNYIIQYNLHIGRKKLIEEKKGERFKLVTDDENELDVMFIDERGRRTFGSTLVICTEGNAGFYEIGIMITPLDLGYSVLGWNHPGFGCSTGAPYIESEKCAINTVMQFAFQKLNFTPENIILFGWSIGGFTSSYAAASYPDVKAVILDATFDDILPLAVKQMPAFMESVVSVTIRDHANLDVASYLIQYNGPIFLIRRSEDEIISVVEGDITTNRGNYLLVKILKTRYPHLCTNESVSALWSWLSVTGQKRDLIYEKYSVDLEECKSEYESHKEKYPREYPSTFGEEYDEMKKIHMILYLADIYMIDFPSSHCTSLSSNTFHSFLEI